MQASKPCGSVLATCQQIVDSASALTELVGCLAGCTLSAPGLSTRSTTARTLLSAPASRSSLQRGVLSMASDRGLWVLGGTLPVMRGRV